jgi:hypothetical protein
MGTSAFQIHVVLFKLAIIVSHVALQGLGLSERCRHLSRITLLPRAACAQLTSRGTNEITVHSHSMLSVSANIVIECIFIHNSFPHRATSYKHVHVSDRVFRKSLPAALDNYLATDCIQIPASVNILATILCPSIKWSFLDDGMPSSSKRHATNAWI